MRYSVEIVKSAVAVPADWDQLIANCFQSREFLLHTEKYNYCQQRYYLFYQDKLLKAGAIVYSLRLDLLTYLAVKSPFSMHIVGVPCSVSASGMVGDETLFPALTDEIKKQERGMLLLLNLDGVLKIDRMISGRTLPTMVFQKKFDSYAAYESGLRASYRRRLHRIAGTFTGVEKQVLPCSAFTAIMHGQYLAVLKHSKGKLETLTLDFFQQLPSWFILTTYSFNAQCLGWKITVDDAPCYYFFLGGIDYSLNRQFNTYYNLLLDVLKEGIESRAEVIDFGQTAEVPKMRLGCFADEKTMLAYHSNALFRNFLKAGKKVLEYSIFVGEAHVFKEEL